MQKQHTEKKSRRGFASMSKEKQRAIAAKGGKLAHALGKAYEWDEEAASIAGRKGGLVTQERNRLKKLQMMRKIQESA